MEIRVLDTAEAVAEEGARFFANALAEEPALTAAIATGRSPIALYSRLAELRARGEVDTKSMIAFQLDTYAGIADDDDRSLWGWMESAFLAPLAIGKERQHRLDGLAPDLAAECARYDRVVAEAGGLGLAVLGLGPNGHLGFNEPPSPPEAPSRVVELTSASQASNATYWMDRPVPSHGMTLGMSALLASRRVLLVVTGTHKHDILHRTLESKPTADLPASWLQNHPRTLVLADRAAWEERA